MSPTDAETRSVPLSLGRRLGIALGLVGFVWGFVFGFFHSLLDVAVLDTISIAGEWIAILLSIPVSPLALHDDRKRIRAVTDWEPSALFYLVAVPYANVIVSAYYLWKRKQVVSG